MLELRASVQLKQD